MTLTEVTSLIRVISMIRFIRCNTCIGFTSNIVVIRGMRAV